MASAPTINTQDVISGSLAQCYITIRKKRYNFMSIIKLEATITKSKKEIAMLGKTGKAHRNTGWTGAFTGTAHYNQSVMRQLMAQYARDGVDETFTIEVINEDPASRRGRQDVLLLGCSLDGGVLAKFDASSDTLEEDINGTFDDFKILSDFSTPSKYDI